MHTIRVVNIRKEACDFYVGRGRGSVLGNPFSVEQYGRETCIKRYRSWLLERIAERDPKVCAALNQIYLTARRGPVTLGCFCAPKSCHAEVIAEVVMNAEVQNAR